MATWTFRYAAGTQNTNTQYASSTVTGDCTIVCVAWLDVTLNSVTDDRGSIYTAIPGTLITNSTMGTDYGGTVFKSQMWICKSIAGNNPTVTANFSSTPSTSGQAIGLVSFQPSPASGASLDQHAAAAGNGAPTGGSITSTIAHSFFVSFILAENVLGGHGTGWTNAYTSTYTLIQYRSETSTGTITGDEGSGSTSQFLGSIANVGIIDDTPSNFTNGLDVFGANSIKDRVTYLGKVLGPGGGGSTPATHGQGFPTRQ